MSQTNTSFSSPSICCVIHTFHTHSPEGTVFLPLFPVPLPLTCPPLKKPASAEIILCLQVYLYGVSFFHTTRFEFTPPTLYSSVCPLHFSLASHYSMPYIIIICGNVCFSQEIVSNSYRAVLTQHIFLGSALINGC